MLFRRRGLGFGRRGFNFHFGRRSSNGFGMYNRRGGRKTGIIIGVILAILVILLVLVFSIRIKDVEVSGNKQYTKEQIESLLFDGKWSRNSAFCYYQNRFKEHKSIPFIEEYKINFKSPTKVEVVVFEKSVVGCVSYMSSYMYFDKDGIIVESSSEQLPGVPVITGLEFGHLPWSGVGTYRPPPAASGGGSGYFRRDLKPDPGAECQRYPGGQDQL